ncbi:hypothetical protein ACFWZ7_14445 [Nocardiopsis alba]|uniref:hypothetical protein n=1 Tax=Nocardiopsis alba TaxID=53437 RepID=UPI00367256FA
MTTIPDLDTSALEHVLNATAGVPELHTPILLGESENERVARHTAAADITDVLLAEHRGGLRAGVDELARLCRIYADLIEHQVRERVASWIPDEEAAA